MGLITSNSFCIEYISMSFTILSTLETWWNPSCFSLIWSYVFFIHLTKGCHNLKKNRQIWDFFPNSGTPPPPLFGIPISKKYILCLFCLLACKDHFCFEKNMSKCFGHFHLEFGKREPPSPHWGKSPKFVFFLWNLSNFFHMRHKLNIF